MMEKTQLKIANKPMSTRQLVAAEALATGMSQREACREQGISRSVLQSWLKKPDFVAQVEEFRQAILVEVRGRLLKLLPDATEAYDSDRTRSIDATERTRTRSKLIVTRTFAPTDRARVPCRVRPMPGHWADSLDRLSGDVEAMTVSVRSGGVWR